MCVVHFICGLVRIIAVVAEQFLALCAHRFRCAIETAYRRCAIQIGAVIVIAVIETTAAAIAQKTERK